MISALLKLTAELLLSFIVMINNIIQTTKERRVYSDSQYDHAVINGEEFVATKV